MHVHRVDVSDAESTAVLWDWLAEKGLVIDVLVLNASPPSPIKSIMESGLDEVWKFYKINVHGHMDFAERFYKQNRSDRLGPGVRHSG